ncbi:adenylate/guanylate cyclase domain-containing protein [Microbispora triticiradicis]|uniref:Adenylate/guanylate cyclase domain-containing protein n=1 Tax=Microbispora triticiradicis TaxID=2200763 RepID=A0ABX9LRY9_9ACTN|nr:AAA family ATPase [Microbispora triticiradicis]RGA06709.1 adenylate/guanylate cyclase domain-containing protein [Microbispora triticiradicis]GLW25489.1 guanylate cyclase [Microbispora amethystogenes]
MTAGAARPARRNVVVVFIDLVGSTELAERLDPELLRDVLDRYYQACTSGISEHGGVVEKYIGDAIMAVFGIPAGREDDALRAVRAAHAALQGVRELSDGLAPTHGIRLDVHCGVSAGEAVVIPTPGADLRVIGDTVNTAARLQSAAGVGEILVGDEVARLVRAQARLESVPPLTLKGKSNPVRAWRVTSVEPDAGDDDDQVPLIGRAAETARLRTAYREAVRDHRCRVVTVFGVPGIGKSRLVRDFVHELPAEVTVLTGRCRSYGAGITYRPIAEMIESLGDDWPDTLEAASGAALRGLVTAHAARPPRTGEDAGVEEIARAVCALFEALARREPLVVVWEDLHWAEPTLLDLIDDLTTWLVDVPVLVVRVARPELLEARPSWGIDVGRAVAFELGALDMAQMERLVAGLAELRSPEGEVVAHAVAAGPALFRRVAESSDGNPLFAELLLETLAEEGEDAPLPRTIQALLGARLDLLDDGERDVLERAATIGHVFTLDQLGVLCAAQPETRFDVDETVGLLIRRRLVRRGEAAGSFHFTQTLTRDTVYAMTRKDLRATWHLALADRISGLPGRAEAAVSSSSGEESSHGDLTHHLETACLLKREVRPDDPLLPALTERAARALVGEGTRALHRKDLPAAIALLERGRDLLPAGHPEHRPLAVRICDAGLARGEADRPYAALDMAERMLPGDPRTRLTCAVQRETLAVRFGTRPASAKPFRDLLAADPGDDLGWCRFHHLEALLRIGEGRFGAAEAALREALDRARSLGDRYEESRLLSGLCELAQWSPTPLAEGLSLCAGLSARFCADRAMLLPVLVTEARLLALAGDVAEAWAVLHAADRHARDLHLDLAAAAVLQVRGLVESLVGRHAEAEALFRRAAADLHRVGQSEPARTLELYAARELLRLGRHAEAAGELARLRATGTRLQARGELTLLALSAWVASLDGDHGAAGALAARAEELLARTDDPCLRGDVLADLAKVHHAAGRTGPAAEAAARALRGYAAKGAELPARRVRRWIEEERLP